jgi:adenosylcobinamide-GDP ribazoletransferase
VAPLIDGLVAGIAFYSRLPVPSSDPAAPSLERMAPVLPLVSLAIGLAPALLAVLLTLVGLPGVFAAGLAVALYIGVTGAMAEDALADAADGLLGGTTASRRLEIMRDSRHGTYGVLALVLLVLLRVLAVGAIVTLHPVAVIGAWLAAMVLARSGSLWLAMALPPARRDGLSASMGRVSKRAFAIGLGIAAILAAVLSYAVGGAAGLILIALGTAAVTAGWTWACRRFVGGQTGDLIGALQALIELAVLTVLLALA